MKGMCMLQVLALKCPNFRFSICQALKAIMVQHPPPPLKITTKKTNTQTLKQKNTEASTKKTTNSYCAGMGGLSIWGLFLTVAPQLLGGDSVERHREQRKRVPGIPTKELKFSLKVILSPSIQLPHHTMQFACSHDQCTPR